MYVLGLLWSMLHGFRPFCDGLKMCEHSGRVLEWPEFWERQFWIVVLLSSLSLIATLGIQKIIREREREKK